MRMLIDAVMELAMTGRLSEETVKALQETEESGSSVDDAMWTDVDTRFDSIEWRVTEIEKKQQQRQTTSAKK